MSTLGRKAFDPKNRDRKVAQAARDDYKTKLKEDKYQELRRQRVGVEDAEKQAQEHKVQASERKGTKINGGLERCK